MASSQPDLLIQTVMNEATRLGDFLAGLDESAWSRDSACEGWVIGDVVAHLAGGPLPGLIPSTEPWQVTPVRRKDKNSWPRVSEGPSSRRKPPGLPINSSGCSRWRTSAPDTLVWHRS